MAAKKLFVKLQQLKTLWADDASWQENIASNGVAEDYTIATDSDNGDSIEEKFANSEMEFVDDIRVFDFMGSENEEARFYEKDVQVYKHTDGTYWVKWTDDIYAV